MIRLMILPMVIVLFVFGVVWHREHVRQPTNQDVQTAAAAVDDLKHQIQTELRRPELPPLHDEWDRAVALMSACGVDWAIVEATSANLGLYRGPAKAWHGAMKAALPEHLMACASYLSNHTDTLIDQVAFRNGAAAITFSVLGREQGENTK